jgi:hypothetical protein
VEICDRKGVTKQYEIKREPNGVIRLTVRGQMTHHLVSTTDGKHTCTCPGWENGFCYKHIRALRALRLVA